MCNIQPGEEVEYVNDPSIKAVVVDDRHIEYKGQTTSLSALAGSLLNVSSVQGPLYFTYNGKLLTDLRDEMGGLY